MADVFEFGGFRFDPRARVLWRDTELVAVPPKALDVLAVLLERGGEVVGKDELLQRAWPDAVVEEANLSVNVSILRKVLGAPPGGGAWIATVARRGYRFAGDVRPVSRGVRAVAILPFRAMGGGDEALSLAMADAVITRLAGGGVAVRPTSAVQRYAGADIDPRAAGRALAVDAVLDGRVQRDGGRMRVTVQLLPVAGDAPLWADRFDAPADDLFAVQDAVAERLAQALSVEPAATRARPRLAAYEAYVRGRWFWTRFSRSWTLKGVASFHEAAELDPAYAAPHAGLADASLVFGLVGLLPPREAWEIAGIEAERALALDDTLPEAHVSSAFVRLFGAWDWAGADRALEQAMRLAPASPSVLQWRGLFDALRGRPDAAAEALFAARAADPLSLVASAIEGFRLGLSGEHAHALSQQRRTAELDPNQFLGHWALGIALQNVGAFAEAVEAHRRALSLAEDAPLLRPVLARSLALAGQPDAARALLDPAEGVEVTPSPYQEATVRLALGEGALALAALHAACEARDPWAVLLPVDPMLRPLAGDPAFRALVARVRGSGSHAPEDRS